MKLSILAVGNRQPEWVVAGCDEYLKRMPRELPASVIEIKPEARNGGRSREQLMAGERSRLEAALPGGARIVALDERGEDLSSEKFARRLETWMGEGRDACFLIGGADGLDPALKTRAETLLRLSSMTLPHGVARLLLCEQLYRAASLIKGHPYHRA
jgi:23S rRNA (pseudouridine1915-N3)-methyltransferase